MSWFTPDFYASDWYVDNPTETEWDAEWDLIGNVYITTWDSLDNEWALTAGAIQSWAVSSNNSATWGQEASNSSLWQYQNPIATEWDADWDLTGNVIITVWDGIDNQWAVETSNAPAWGSVSGNAASWGDRSGNSSSWNVQNPVETAWESGTDWDLFGNVYITTWDSLDDTWADTTNNVVGWQ